MIGYTAFFEINLGLRHIFPFSRHLQSELTRLKVKDPLRSCEVGKEDIVLAEDGESLVSCKCHITVLLMYVYSIFNLFQNGACLDPYAATLLNALPNNIKTSACLATFKARLKTYFF